MWTVIEWERLPFLLQARGGRGVAAVDFDKVGFQFTHKRVLGGKGPHLTGSELLVPFSRGGQWGKGRLQQGRGCRRCASVYADSQYFPSFFSFFLARQVAFGF